jgi:hypothetical protein
MISVSYWSETILADECSNWCEHLAGMFFANLVIDRSEVGKLIGFSKITPVSPRGIKPRRP